MAFGAVHKLCHTEGGKGVSASVTTYTLSIHQYGTSYDKGGGGGGEGGFIMVKNNVTYFMNGLFVAPSKT